MKLAKAAERRLARLMESAAVAALREKTSDALCGAADRLYRLAERINPSCPMSPDEIRDLPEWVFAALREVHAQEWSKPEEPDLGREIAAALRHAERAAGCLGRAIVRRLP